jgi:hypothetical protein
MAAGSFEISEAAAPAADDTDVVVASALGLESLPQAEVRTSAAASATAARAEVRGPPCGTGGTLHDLG